MSHVIGRGRYGRETYPERSAGGSDFPRVGYDQVIEGLYLGPAILLGIFPRNAAGDPLRVTIPGVTPGNTLEVDMRFTVEGLQGAYVYDPDFNFFGVVAIATFDGSMIPPPGGTFQLVMNSQTSESVEKQSLNTISLSSLAAVEIPVGATTAVVEVIFSSSQTIFVAGLALDFESLSGATLKVSEIKGSATAQLGPGVLVPIP